ncbi:MAG: hypothetical protein H5U23_14585, partial [Phenylobacterium sp.]|nr:hypothetical protein [Phenylobacterium sp.]
MEASRDLSRLDPLNLAEDAADTAREVRRQAQLLSELLNEAIAYLDGEEAAAQVRAGRAA